MRRLFRFPYPFIMAGVLLISILSMVCMIYHGIFIPNKLWIRKNDIIGCDISHYQGDIAWDILSQQGISFVFIKATEGSSHIDPKFKENWSQAFETSLYVGAYHFFSFESPGKNQAEHFSAQVGKKPSMLLPVVDVEFYGTFNRKNTNAAQVTKQLDSYIQVIKETYGVEPIIYTTMEAYDHLIKGRYQDCPLWIRNVITRPNLDREWILWQYTNRETLKGYDGSEAYIDMNVFHGDLSEFSLLVME